MTNEQAQQLFGQAQIYQQKMQNVLMQKESFSLQLKEIESALKELEKEKSADVYKIAGPVLIKKSITEMKKELKDKEGFISLRLKTLEKEEKEINEKMGELRDKLTKASTMAGA